VGEKFLRLTPDTAFSRLGSAFQAQTNRLYRERDARIGRGEPVIDLISGNVTEHGIRFPQSVLDPIWRDAARKTRVYRPHPLGQPAAREAISSYYRSLGLTIPSDRILLTPGTSLAYWYVFSILCDPDDEVLTPRPSYPLFDDIARMAHVRLVSYRLEESRDWAIDLADLEAKVSPRTRAIVLVSPHNPTGAVAAEDEIRGIAEIAARRSLPVIVDEVFGEFIFGRDALPRPAATGAPLVFTLNGFSKMFALPGLKLGWIALSGDDGLVRQAVTALETVSDAFLPVNETVQASAPAIFREGNAFLTRYRKEITRRRDATIEALTDRPALGFVPPRGGFYIAIRVASPVSLDDEELALHVLRSTGCLVHPGFFYDLDPTHLVVSLVSDPAVSGPALRSLAGALAR